MAAVLRMVAGAARAHRRRRLSNARRPGRRASGDLALTLGAMHSELSQAQDRIAALEAGLQTSSDQVTEIDGLRRPAQADLNDERAWCLKCSIGDRHGQGMSRFDLAKMALTPG